MFGVLVKTNYEDKPRGQGEKEREFFAQRLQRKGVLGDGAYLSPTIKNFLLWLTEEVSKCFKK